MENPFQRRATEQVKSEEAFLAIVTPEPVSMYLVPHGATGQLYDRLVVIYGTPGSGKTTIARLFEFTVLMALRRGTDSAAHRPIKAALHQSRALQDDWPTIMGARLPLESDYREIWEFPYEEEIKEGLLEALVQARAVLAWFRYLDRSGIPVADVKVVLRENTPGAVLAIGGSNPEDIRRKATDVERDVYRVVGALVPPPLEQIGKHALQAYKPFNVIEAFTLPGPNGKRISLQPAIFLDDAHTLHPRQFRSFRQWLLRREMPVARWLLARMDVLSPAEVLELETDSHQPELPGITKTRDMIEISFQGTGSRTEQRKAFRKMARDMADRYLRQMAIFRGQHIEQFSSLLSTRAELLNATKCKELESRVAAEQRRHHISASRREKLETQVANFQPAGEELSAEERLVLLSILMNRYAKRTPQNRLFSEDPEPSRTLTVDSTMFQAARLRLLHEFDRPFYFGSEDVFDASSENAEQFLRLAGVLVEASATRIIRRQSEVLSARTQHELLRSRAAEFISAWDIPQGPQVQGLIERIARECLETSLKPNAWIGAGANAYGIPHSEFKQLATQAPDLAKTLKYAVAYNALVLLPEYECKNQLWTLFELGGLPILRYGLTLRRGGFVEGTLEELISFNRELTD
jgi:hypothetical protein